MRETLSTCPVCNGSDVHEYIQTNDYSTSKENFTVFECKSCTHLFTNPRVTEEKVGPYYDNPNYISHTDESTSFFGRVYQSLRDINLGFKNKYVDRVTSPGSLVLDYGCGTGQFVERLSKSGYQVEGVEINEGARAKASNFGKVSDSISEVSSGISTITMWHVMEHVYGPHDLLQEFKARLNPGGHVIIAVPNPDSYDAKYYKRWWAAWDVPIHVHHFRKRSMNALLEANGFELKRVTKMNMDSFYIALLSEQYKAQSDSKGLFMWLKASVIGLVSNLRGIGGNTSSLIYTYQLKDE